MIPIQTQTVSTISGKPTKTRFVMAGVGLVVISLAVGMSPNTSNKVDPRDANWQVAIDPHKVIGYQSCEKCHASEVQAWKRTPHHETFLTLHRKPEAQQIANKLGISDFKSESNCIQCHYTMDQIDNRLEAIAGVSCESCHGSAQDWVGHVRAARPRGR
ncbi:MAG: cytochrome c family protein, partial [Pirellula sp.]